MTRYQCNMGIIHKLQNFFADNPNIRFFQGLQILDLQESYFCQYRDIMIINDNFHEESEKTLSKLNNSE